MQRVNRRNERSVGKFLRFLLIFKARPRKHRKFHKYIWFKRVIVVKQIDFWSFLLKWINRQVYLVQLTKDQWGGCAEWQVWKGSTGHSAEPQVLRGRTSLELAHRRFEGYRAQNERGRHLTKYRGTLAQWQLGHQLRILCHPDELAKAIANICWTWSTVELAATRTSRLPTDLQHYYKAIHSTKQLRIGHLKI